MLLHLRTFLVSAALLASGLNATADTLTVYTYDSFTGEYGPGPQLEPLFEKHCRCDLVFEALEDGVSILNRLKIEADQTQGQWTALNRHFNRYFFKPDWIVGARG